MCFNEISNTCMIRKYDSFKKKRSWFPKSVETWIENDFENGFMIKLSKNRAMYLVDVDLWTVRNFYNNILYSLPWMKRWKFPNMAFENNLP